MSEKYINLTVYNYVTKDTTEYINVYNVSSKNKMVQFVMKKGLLTGDSVIRLTPAIITFSEQVLVRGNDKR